MVVIGSAKERAHALSFLEVLRLQALPLQSRDYKYVLAYAERVRAYNAPLLRPHLLLEMRCIPCTRQSVRNLYASVKGVELEYGGMCVAASCNRQEFGSSDCICCLCPDMDTFEVAIRSFVKDQGGETFDIIPVAHILSGNVPSSGASDMASNGPSVTQGGTSVFHGRQSSHPTSDCARTTSRSPSSCDCTEHTSKGWETMGESKIAGSESNVSGEQGGKSLQQACDTESITFGPVIHMNVPVTRRAFCHCVLCGL